MKYFSLVAAAVFCLIYLSAWIPPTETFNLWLLAFLIPAALVANIILFVAFAWNRKKGAFYFLVAGIVGFPYLLGTIGGMKSWLTKPEPAGSQLSVLNYNVGGFQVRTYHGQNSDSVRYVLKNWILDNDTDIKCFQEFPSNWWSRRLNVLARLDSLGVNYYFSRSANGTRHFPNDVGILIISRYPIVSTGDVLASENGFNRIAYVDIEKDTDTLRIVSVHLESMGLSGLDQDPKSLDAVKSTTRALLRKLKAGVFQRSQQVRSLTSFIDASPYPVICVGDFNDLPYAYSYQHLRKFMKNSFEESGRGFGFTYNGGKLRWLRIDNQFYTEGVHSTSFETLRSVNLSDHFPVRASYVIDSSR